MSRRAVREPGENRRGAPEAIAKRRAGRAFNDLFDDGAGGGALDGRTKKRRARLLLELEQGKTRASGRELKPLDVLDRVSELLDLGEPLVALKKICRPRQAPAAGARLVDAIRELHRAYRFRPEAYRFVGVDDAVLRAAGVLKAAATERRARATSDLPSSAAPSHPPPPSRGRRSAP
jgi:hypothetical protein